MGFRRKRGGVVPPGGVVPRPKPIEWDLKRMPKQGEFVASTADFPAFFGGFSNGKTLSACIRAWIHSQNYPGNSGLICRRQVKDLIQSTRAEFFRVVGCNESTIEKHPWVERWSAQENMLRLRNGSEIFFRHLSDENALGSLLGLNLRWFMIDQAEDVPEAAFLTLVGRIGRTETDVYGAVQAPAWGAITGNPAGHNWVWRLFKRGADSRGITVVPPDLRVPGARSMSYHLIEATTFDCPWTSRDYINRMLTQYPGHWAQRFVYGNWDSFKGQVYDEFDVNVHVIDPFEVPPDWRMGLGCDLGYNHPTAFVWCAIDYEGTWYVYDEFVERERLPDYFAGELKRRGVVDNFGGQLPVYAPHDAANRSIQTGRNMQQAYLDEGLDILQGNKMPVSAGILRIKQMLQVRPEIRHPYTGRMGAPRLYFMRNCEHLIEEFGLYRWAELRPGQEAIRDEEDKVVKVNDDAVDALRYWAMGAASTDKPERRPKMTLEEIDLRAFIEEEVEEDADHDPDLSYMMAA